MASDKNLESLSLSFSSFNIGGNKPEQTSSLLSLIQSVCADKDFGALATILRHTRFVPLEPVDENGNTLLHFIIIHFQEMGGAPFLQTFLTFPDSKKLLNTQAKQSGHTPAVLACSLKLHNVIDMLVEAGADLSIPSRSGEKVQVETTEQTPVEKILEKKLSVEKLLEKKSSEKSPNGGKGILDALPLGFLKKLRRDSPRVSTEASTLQLTTPAPQKEEIKKVFSKEQAKPETVSTLGTLGMTHDKPVKISQTSEMCTDDFIIHLTKLPEVKTSPEKKPEAEKKPEVAVGGSRSVIVGQRYLNQIQSLTTTSVGGARSESSSSEEPKRKSVELSRATDDIHQKTVEEIKDLMGVDEETAKIYKSVIYYRVKEKNPTMTGYERAIEMQKQATKENLKDIDIEAERKRRAELFASKSASSSEESSASSKKSKKSKKAETSSSSSSSSEEKPKKKGKSKKATSTSSSESTSSPDLETAL